MFVFTGDEIPDTTLVTRKGSKVKLVIIDRKTTTQFVFNMNFLASNLASLPMIATTIVERISPQRYRSIPPMKSKFSTGFIPHREYATRLKSVSDYACFDYLLSTLNITSQASQIELVRKSNDTKMFLSIAAIIVPSPLIQCSKPGLGASESVSALSCVRMSQLFLP